MVCPIMIWVQVVVILLFSVGYSFSDTDVTVPINNFAIANGFLESAGTVSNQISFMQKTITGSRYNPTQTNGIGGQAVLKDFKFVLKRAMNPLDFLGCELTVQDDSGILYVGKITDTRPNNNNKIEYMAKGVLSINDSYINGSENPVYYGASGFVKLDTNDKNELVAPQGVVGDSLYIKDKDSDRKFPILEPFEIVDGIVRIHPTPEEVNVIKVTNDEDNFISTLALENPEIFCIKIKYASVINDYPVALYIPSSTEYYEIEADKKWSLEIPPKVGLNFVATRRDFIDFDGAEYMTYEISRNYTASLSYGKIFDIGLFSRSYNSNLDKYTFNKVDLVKLFRYKQSPFINQVSFNTWGKSDLDNALQGMETLGMIGNTARQNLTFRIVDDDDAEIFTAYKIEDQYLSIYGKEFDSNLSKIYLVKPYEETLFVTVRFDAKVLGIINSSKGFYNVMQYSNGEDYKLWYKRDFRQVNVKNKCQGFLYTNKLWQTKDYSPKTIYNGFIGANPWYENTSDPYNVSFAICSYLDNGVNRILDSVIFNFDFPTLTGRIQEQYFYNRFFEDVKESFSAGSYYVNLGQTPVDGSIKGSRIGICKEPFKTNLEYNKILITGDKTQDTNNEEWMSNPTDSSQAKGLRITDYNEFINTSIGFTIQSDIDIETQSWVDQKDYPMSMEFILQIPKIETLLETPIQDNEFYLEIADIVDPYYDNPVTIIQNLLLDESNIDISKLDITAFDSCRNRRLDFKCQVSVTSEMSVNSLVDDLAKENGLFVYETNDGLVSIICIEPPEDMGILTILTSNEITGDYKENFLGLNYLISSMDVSYINGTIESADLGFDAFEKAKSFLNGEEFKTKLDLKYCKDESTAMAMSHIKMLFHQKPTRELSLTARDDSLLYIGQWFKLDSSCQIDGTENNVYLITKSDSPVIKVGVKFSVYEYDIDFIDGVWQETMDSGDVLDEQTEIGEIVTEVL